MSEWWRYENLPSGEPYNWDGTSRGENPWDNEDFHVDLGAGRVKKGRLGIDHRYSPGIDALIDLEELGPTDPAVVPAEADPCMEQTYALYDAEARRREALHDFPAGTVLPYGYLPFPDCSIKSVISHHVLEHLDAGFMRLMDEVHRVLEPGGLFRIIVPAFPSGAAVSDPTHRRFFTQATWYAFTGAPDGPRYTDGFAEPYCSAQFALEDIDMSPYPKIEGTPIVDVEQLWGPDGAREFRVAYRKHEE